MRKGAIPILVWILAGIIVLAVGSQLGYFSTIGEPQAKCQNIYGYQPSFRCCVETKSNSGSLTTSASLTTPFQCPATATRCTVTYDMDCKGGACATWWKAPNSDCHTLNSLFGTPLRKQCSGEVVQSGNSVEMKPTEWFYGQVSTGAVTQNGAEGHMQYQIYTRKLCDTSIAGTASSDACATVGASDSCGFVTSDLFYKPNGLLVDSQSALGGYAYTVPITECYTYYPTTNAHVIGNTCDACDSSSDCTSQHSLQYTYSGKVYGAECDGQNIQLYDCLPKGGTTCVKWNDANKDGILNNGETCQEQGLKSKCDFYLAIPLGGGCCPSTSSCGANAFCDPNTFKCVASGQAGCTGIAGLQVVCDYVKKELKTPQCNNGKLDWNTQPIECCYDVNCPPASQQYPNGFRCATDQGYKCVEKIGTKQACTLGCCKDETTYLDKPCGPGETCCADHICKIKCDATVDTCNFNGKCEAERGETAANCRDCLAGNNGNCPPIDLGWGIKFPDIICMIGQWWALYGMYIIIIIILIIAAVFVGVLQ